jgi:hypothetical protein
MRSSSTVEEVVKSRLTGTWRLLSCEATADDGSVSYPYGHNPVGYLIYTPQGFMAVSIMSRNPPRVASDDLLAGLAREFASDGEHQPAFAYVSYSGRFDVWPAQGATSTLLGEAGGATPHNILAGTVVHHLETCSYPNWVGTDQRRTFELTDDHLTLITPPLLRRGVRATARLMWKRA